MAIGFKAALAVIALMFATACAMVPPLDTTNKKIAAAEITFQGAVRTVDRLLSTAIITKDEAKNLTNTLAEVDAGLDQVAKYKDIGDLEEADRVLAITNALLFEVMRQLQAKQPAVISWQMNAKSTEQI